MRNISYYHSYHKQMDLQNPEMVLDIGANNRIMSICCTTNAHYPVVRPNIQHHFRVLKIHLFVIRMVIRNISHPITFVKIIRVMEQDVYVYLVHKSKDCKMDLLTIM